MLNEIAFFRQCVQSQNFPKKIKLKHIILKRIIKEFKSHKIYTEQEINEKIRTYFKDFVTIRRELVNFNYLKRDSLKQEYRII